MSDYTKDIRIEPDGNGYIVTITERVDGTDIVTEESFPDADTMKVYVRQKVDEANAQDAIFELKATRKKGEVAAWLRELDSVGHNDYYTVRRPELIEWMQKWHWRYTEPGERPVDCEISGGGQLSPVGGGRNLIRITPDNRRKWSAGTGQGFEVFSSDLRFWKGYDSQGNRHLFERIEKV